MATYNALETMKTIRFGVEIETVGKTRRAVAHAVQSVVGGTIAHIGSPSCYDPWKITAPDGRVWTVMRDGSLPQGGGAEIVTPICRYEDIETIQEVARAVRRIGARADESTCGIHIHIDGARFDAAGISRLAKLTYSQEELMVKALRCESRMSGRWCGEVSEAFIQRLRRAGTPASLSQISTAWYNGNADWRARDHYDGSRYTGLNLHSLFFRGTVEFRYFNATLHAGKIKSYIQLCLGLGAKALNSRGAAARKRSFNPSNPRYAFRTFLIRLGMNGQEFKTLRHHLLNHLPGNSSWAGNRPPAPASPQPQQPQA